MSNQVPEVWEDLANIPADPPKKREICSRCRRPCTVCWCSFLPAEPVQIKSKVIILQHPGEEKRCLRTAPMLEFALPPGHFHVFKGRKFNSLISNKLKSVMESPNSVLLYPGPDAVNLDEFISSRVEPFPSYNIIILDGTWPQAKSLYYNNEELSKLKQVQINSKNNSEYVIRTQPTDNALSTVETAAIALAILEGKPNLKEVLVKPLKALCSFQLSHGAVTHHSKEYLMKNGLYKGQRKIYFPDEYLV